MRVHQKLTQQSEKRLNSFATPLQEIMVALEMSGRDREKQHYSYVPTESDDAIEALEIEDHEEGNENSTSNGNHEVQFSFSVTVAFTLNYIMGTGFLTLPWAFYKAGCVLSTIILAILIVPSLIAVSFTLETMARAEAIRSQYTPFTISSDYMTIAKVPVNETRRKKLLSFFGRDAHHHSEHPQYLVGKRKFEINELCEMFLGAWGARLYTLFLSMYMYGVLWVFSSVFAKALTSAIPLGEFSYYIYLLLFAIIVVPASCMELSEQIVVQVVLALCRVVMVVFMLVTVLVAYSSEGDDGSSRHFGEVQHADAKEDLFHMNGLHIILPIACYANVFHQSIPPLAEPSADKKQLTSIFSTTLFICIIAYSLVGFALSFYFGENIESSANLNWAHYGAEFTNPFAKAIASVVQFFVIIFPALDVGSAFPLNAITLGNNLFTTFLGAEATRNEKSKLIYFRLFACVPPIMGAAIMSKLGTITDYAGVAGFVIGFMFPAALAYLSERYMRERKMDPRTYYSGAHTGAISWIAVFSFGIFLVVFVVSSLVMVGSPE